MFRDDDADRSVAELDALIADLTVDAYGDGEQLAGFHVGAEDALGVPQIAMVVGVAVDVVAIVDGPDERRGLEAVCVRGGEEYRVSLADVVFSADSEIGRVVAAYRHWLGLQPWSQRAPSGPSAASAWRYPGHVRGPGAAALEVARPLRLLDPRPWDPADEYWAEPDERPPEWAIPIIAAGPRTSYAFEQVLPGADDDIDSDPILDAVEHAQAGDPGGARRRLRALLAADSRCLDAHAHLAWLAFEHSARGALTHYEAGVAIAERSLPEGFDGVLPWMRIDNRPFLRCLHGLAVSLWRLERWDEAAAAAVSLLWLNPADNQGASDVVADVHARVPWLPADRR